MSAGINNTNVRTLPLRAQSFEKLALTQPVEAVEDTNEDRGAKRERFDGPKLRNKAATRMLLAQTPTQPIALLPAVKDPTPPDSSGDLFSYLTALLLFQIGNGKNQTDLTKINVSLSETSMTKFQAALQKEADAIGTSNSQEASAHKTSIWGSVLSMVGVAVGALVFAMTGSPILLIMSIVSMATSSIETSDGKSLDQGLSDAVGQGALSLATEMWGGTPPPALVTTLKDVLLGSITLAEAALLGGVEKLLQNGSKEAEQVASALASDGAVAAEDAASAAVKVAPSATKALASKFLIALAYNGTLLPAVSQQFATACFPNDEEGRAIFGAVLQFALSAAAGAAGAQMSAAANSQGFVKMLSSKMGESAFLWTSRIAKGAQTAINASAAGCEISTGLMLLQESDTLKQQGGARYALDITQRLVDVLRTASSANSKTFNAANQSINEMMQSAERRLEALDPQNYR